MESGEKRTVQASTGPFSIVATFIRDDNVYGYIIDSRLNDWELEYQRTFSPVSVSHSRMAESRELEKQLVLVIRFSIEVVIAGDPKDCAMKEHFFISIRILLTKLTRNTFSLVYNNTTKVS